MIKHLTHHTFTHEKLLELSNAYFWARNVASVTTISNSEQGIQFNRIFTFKRKVLEKALTIHAEETGLSFDLLAHRYGLATN